jgi:hypothetical protein
MKQSTQRVLRNLVHEIVSDGASNWGGWQGGFPGSGSPLKGLNSGGGKHDTGKIQKYQDVKRKNASWQQGQGPFKLSAKRTKVIVSPTLKQSENKIDTKDATVAPTDMPPKFGKGQTVKQVKEDLANEAVRRYRIRMQNEAKGGDILGNLIAKGAAGLAKHLFKKAKPAKAPAAPKVTQIKPPKPPTQAQQKQADLDASNAKFDAWKRKKGDMARVFKQANDMGLDHDINTPYKSFAQRQASKARLANPLKQPNDPPPVETPAAPTTNTWSASKPRVRVQAGSRPVAPTSKPRMNAGELKDYLKQTKLDPGKHIKLSGKLGERAEQFRAEWNERSLQEYADDLTMFNKPLKMAKFGHYKFGEGSAENAMSSNVEIDVTWQDNTKKRERKLKAEDAPTNVSASPAITTFDPILSASVLKRRKKTK